MDDNDNLLARFIPYYTLGVHFALLLYPVSREVLMHAHESFNDVEPKKTEVIYILL